MHNLFTNEFGLDDLIWVLGCSGDVNDGCLWSWFIIWHTDFISKHDKTELKEVYNLDKVITLDELPEWGKK